MKGKKDKRKNIIAENTCHNILVNLTADKLFTIKGKEVFFSGNLDDINEGNKAQVEYAIRKSFKKPEVVTTKAHLGCL